MTGVFALILISLLAWILKNGLPKSIHKILEQLSNRSHAFISNTLRDTYNESVIAKKKEMFQLMSEKMNFSRIKVLEIGCGSGGNLQFYPTDMEITLIAEDPNIFCKKYLENHLKGYPNIKLQHYSTSVAENMEDISSESIDCVLSTIVLCSVQNQDKVLREVKRVLKPGGNFFFMEHVASPDNGFLATAQKILNPVNRMLLDGCNVNRETLPSIRRAGFSQVNCKGFNANLFYLFAMLRPHITGYAVK